MASPTSNDSPADVLVVFGITGDLAKVMTFRSLYRLERRGLLDEEWSTSETGRQAKYYTLTPKGRAHLRAEVTRWSAFSRAVGRALAASTG